MTLLELLLVVIILSAVAWMSLGLVSNNSNQVRFEDTRNRLNAIRKAVLGSSGTAGWEHGIQSGFVVDNGRLPENINALVNTPGYYDAYGSDGSTQPVFDPVPDGDGINDNNGGEITLSGPEQLLMKGHRGFYVNGTAGGMYRDGWGTDRTVAGAADIDCPTIPGIAVDKGNDLDADNHGWCVTRYLDGLYVDSYGLDGQDGTLTGDVYEQDTAMSEPVLTNDWQIDVTGSSVKVVNQSGNDIDLTALGISLQVSLLVYINDANSDNVLNTNSWLRVTTGSTADTCLDGTGDDECNLLPADLETTATFPANSIIPVGEHLLVLVAVDDDGIVDDTVDLTGLGVGAGQYVTNRVKFFSRGGVPDMVLIIR